MNNWLFQQGKNRFLDFKDASWFNQVTSSGRQGQIPEVLLQGIGSQLPNLVMRQDLSGQAGCSLKVNMIEDGDTQK